MVRSLLPVTLKGACVQKGGTRIIGPLDLQLNESGCTVVMGPNGAGKTTFLRLLHGLERLSSGSMKWNAAQVDVFARQSFVFQTPVIMRRSVRENIAYPLIIRGQRRKVALAEADRLCEEVGLHQHGSQAAVALSGGEKQKLALARALITKPDVLFLDEPSTNLDGASTFEVEKLILAARESGTQIIMATHDFGQAKRLGDDVIFLHHGLLRERGSPDNFFTMPQTDEARAFLDGDILL